MRNWRFGLLWASVALALFAGCTAEQLAQMDKAMQDVNEVGTQITDAAEAAPFLPPEVKLVMEITGLAAAGAFGIWQQVKNKLADRTGSAIVSAVESLPERDQQQIKAAVKAEMKQRNISAGGKALVHRWKGT